MSGKRKIKIFSQIPLRWRLTILTGFVLTLACSAITLVSVLLAQNTYYRIITEDIGNEMPNHTKLLIVMTDKTFYYKLYVMLAMILIIILGTLATYVVAGRALKPATDLAKDIEERDESNLFVPVVTGKSDDEVSRLGHSFNRLIEKLKGAYEQQKRFAASAAHEMKTPLASMIALIEVLSLEENPSQTELMEVLEAVYENSQRLNELVNDLLLIYSMNNKLNQSFDLSNVVATCIEDLKDYAAKKGVSLTSELNNVKLFGEARLIKSAVSNIIENAIRYNKPNGNVEIKVYQQDDKYHINVKDTGIGIDEKEFDKIFEPFYCIDNSRSRSLGGSGLGLSIVKTIVDMHNGTITVNSKLGDFTEFEIVF